MEELLKWRETLAAQGGELSHGLGLADVLGDGRVLAAHLSAAGLRAEPALARRSGSLFEAVSYALYGSRDNVKDLREAVAAQVAAQPDKVRRA